MCQNKNLNFLQKIKNCDKTQTFTKLQTLNITKLKYLMNRLGVVEAVLQTPSAIKPFTPNLQNTITSKQLELKT